MALLEFLGDNWTILLPPLLGLVAVYVLLPSPRRRPVLLGAAAAAGPLRRRPPFARAVPRQHDRLPAAHRAAVHPQDHLQAGSRSLGKAERGLSRRGPQTPPRREGKKGQPRHEEGPGAPAGP